MARLCTLCAENACHHTYLSIHSLARARLGPRHSPIKVVPSPTLARRPHLPPPSAHPIDTCTHCTHRFPSTPTPMPMSTMAQLHFADPLPNYQPPPSTQPVSSSSSSSSLSPHADQFAPQHLRPVHDLFSMLKGVFNAMLDLAPALVADLSHSPSPHLSSYAAAPHQSHQPSQQPPYATVSSTTVSTSIVPLGPSDHSHRSCVDFLRRLLGAGGATELRINSLPVRSLCIEDGVDKLAYEQDMCAICLDGYEHHNRVRVLGCEHVFHTSCIDPWLRRGRPTCPLCQTICC